MKILEERQKTHGDFSDVALIDQSMKAVMRDAPRWANMSSEQQLALEMIAHKMSRILCGDPKTDDHWTDIAGYAELGRRQCAGS